MTPDEAITYSRALIAETLGSCVAADQLLARTDTHALLRRAFTSEAGDLEPRVWTTKPGFMAATAYQEIPPSGDSVPSEIPCPAWCDSAAEHPFTQPNDEHGRAAEALTRIHRHRFSPHPTHAALELKERAAGPNGPSDAGTDPDALLVAVHLARANVAWLTPRGARRLAAELLAAAALADDELGRWSPTA